jgi:hypothetical protein
MTDSNLVLRLRPNVKLYLGDQGNGDGLYALDGQRCATGFPPWPSAADLLVNIENDELCGVTYRVAVPFREHVREMATSFDQRCVTYIEGKVELRPAAYRSESDQFDFLEIRWSSNQPDAIMPAQLASDVWYYEDDRRESASSLQRAVGYGLGDLQGLVLEHNLNLPKQWLFSADLDLRPLAATTPVP